MSLNSTSMAVVDVSIIGVLLFHRHGEILTRKKLLRSASETGGYIVPFMRPDWSIIPRYSSSWGGRLLTVSMCTFPEPSALM